MKRARFLMVGGFLGAGKTTALARLASHFIRKGKSVGLVTNDQAQNLVDTESLRAQGFLVGEVPGACFCCRFDELVATIQGLGASERPDVILAEPVGSCTDLVATVLEPLRQMYDDQFEIGPLAVLLKPEHGKRILRAERGGGFSPKAAYIFVKQLEEADIVVINKIDKLSPEERTELVTLVGDRFPEKVVLSVSARQGDGFDVLIDAVQQPGLARRRSLSLDYDIYAEGEAELGWLNGKVTLTQRTGPISLDRAAVALVEGIRDALAGLSAEPAHLKVMARGGDAWAVANLVGSGHAVELSRSAGVAASAVELIINARVATDPERLENTIASEIDNLAGQLGVSVSIGEMQVLSPGRPEPTHRIVAGG